MNKYIKPVPEKYQRKARLRRIAQAVRDGRITFLEGHEQSNRVEKDYKSWKTM